MGNNSDTDDDNDAWSDADELACGTDSLDDTSIPVDTNANGICDAMEPPVNEGILLATQDWQGFFNGVDWYLTDFGLFLDSNRSDYVASDEIKFDISWTKRTRKLMADAMGIDRDDMDRELANSICPAQIEVGKASHYGAGTSSNMIAELDSDLSQCGVEGEEPATIRIRSFIPTKVGVHYRAEVKYRMRSYDNMPHNAYRHLVMRFGKTKVHFEPVFDAFHTATIEILAKRAYSKLTLTDNGLPDSYGILIDDIQVFELDQNALYDSCIALFAQNSKGFRQCLLGEVDVDQSCTMDNFEFKYRHHDDDDDDGEDDDGEDIGHEFLHNVENALLQQAAQDGVINFLSLGKKGKLIASCYIDNYLAAFPIFNQQLLLQEIAWTGETIENHPEHASATVTTIA